MKKKEIRKTIQEKLSVSLADYRSIVGEKKFERQIRKAAKQFSENVTKALPAKVKKEKDKVVEASDIKDH